MKDITEPEIVEVEGVPCIILDDSWYKEDAWYSITLGFTEKQLQKKYNFLEEVLIELEELWKELVKKDATERDKGTEK